MKKGIKLRLTVHNILHDIYKHNTTFDSKLVKDRLIKYDSVDLSFITNVCLNSMRYKFHAEKIINMFTKKRSKVHENILLISAITQLVFLDFKSYAVINCSVEIAKKLNIYHGFINKCLKEISNNKNKLKSLKIYLEDLPSWFQNHSNNFTLEEKNKFLDTFYKEPSIHIVFKNNENLLRCKYDLIQTTSKSGFLKDKKNIKKMFSLKDNNCWVQDFSSHLPLSNFPVQKLGSTFIDLCSAPGGKAFQILSIKDGLVLNDKSKTRLKLLKKNLMRLNLKTKIINMDVLKMENKNKYDFIVLDAPCSAIGTIRRNPGIFFRNKEPNFLNLISNQENLLDKAVNLLNKNGTLLYMVCSFFKTETVDQIDKLLLRNKSVFLDDFYLSNDNKKYKWMIKNKFLFTLPTNVMDFKTDGYFGAFLKKKNL